jgi:hypothetical protein
VVRRALDAPDATLGTWAVDAIRGGFGTISGASGVHRLAGTATVEGVERPWRLVLKVVMQIDGRDDPRDIYYWKREPLLAASGLLDALPPGIRAPRCYGVDEIAPDHIWIWQEHVEETGPRRWPTEQWALAARHFGRMGGAFAEGAAPVALPDEPWFRGPRLRTWLGRHVPMVQRIEAAVDNPQVNQYWPRPAVDAVLRLWAERETFLTALESLPLTLAHGDAIRRNMLAHRAPDGTDETVAVDWEFTGQMAVGEEVGQTLSVAAAFFDVEPSALPELDGVLFPAYLDGLLDVGWRGDERLVRFAYVAHAALRNGFNAVGSVAPNEAQAAAVIVNQGRTWRELAEQRAQIRPFLLRLADEARALLPQ